MGKQVLGCFYIWIAVMMGWSCHAADKKSDMYDGYFESKNYIVYLDTSKCGEYDIKCDVTYHGVNKHNHHTAVIKGSTLNIGPSLDFRGYIFSRGKYTYMLTPKDEFNAAGKSIWILEVDVSDKDKSLLTEEGVWVDSKKKHTP